MKKYKFIFLFLTSFLFYSFLFIYNKNKINLKLDKSVKVITDSLYTGITEVSNKEYSIFLNYLIVNKITDKYKSCQIDTTAWEILGGDVNTCFEYFHNYHSNSKYQHYPIVNIKYEAAKYYCEWLTVVYNASNNRKFKKVVFRLPTEKEWLIAAGQTIAPYAWGDTSLYEPENGGIRARLHVVDAANPYSKNYPAIAAPVKSFKPNKNGLYNIHGNVSEMISIKGKAKGGSWFSTPQEATLDKIQTYTGPDPRVGFRYFMEVLEK